MRIALAILVVFCISLAYADVWSTYKKRFGKKFKNAQEEKARYFTNSDFSLKIIY